MLLECRAIGISTQKCLEISCTASASGSIHCLHIEITAWLTSERTIFEGGKRFFVSRELPIFIVVK